MSAHDYTPQQALETLLRKLKERDESLEAIVRAAIDLGRDILEEQRIGRKRVRRYRKTVPFTHEEALHISLDVLQAYFVELPLCINSAMENFKSAAVGASWRDRPLMVREEKALLDVEHVGDEKPVEIELQTVTQISITQQQTIPLKTWERRLVDLQSNNSNAIATMFDFTEER